MGPVVPYLSDSPAQLEAAVRGAAEAGAQHVVPIVLQLRAGAREGCMGCVGRGAYARKDYQARIGAQVRELAERFGVGRGRRPADRGSARRISPPPAAP